MPVRSLHLVAEEGCCHERADERADGEEEVHGVHVRAAAEAAPRLQAQHVLACEKKKLCGGE